MDGGAAGVFFTHPGLAISVMHAFGDEIVLTAILVLGIFAITEEFNTVAPQASSGALIIGLLVAAIGACAGYLEAWATNSRPRSGTASVCLDGRLGRGSLSFTGQLLVGRSLAPCWAASWAAAFTKV